MKKLIALFVLMLLLSGCVHDRQTETSAATAVPAPSQTTPTVQPEVEELPIEMFSVQASAEDAVYMLGKNPLLCSPSGKLTLLEGKSGEKLAERQISPFIAENALSASSLGVCCYDSASQEAVVLNPALQETERIQLPEDINGFPGCSMQTHEVYFCQGQELRGVNLNTGISRLIKKQNCKNQEITGVFFHGELLRCKITDLSGETEVQYIQTSTGTTVSTDDQITALYTGKECYFACRMDGNVPQQIFGLRGQPPRGFQYEGNLHPVLENNCAVTAVTDDSDLFLSYFDLTEGMFLGVQEFPGVDVPVSLASDGEMLWFLAPSTEKAEMRLVRWNPSCMENTEPKSWEVPLYVGENVDEQGIAACKNRGEALGKAHGLQIYVGKDAVSEENSDYEAECQVPVIEDMLNRLEQVVPCLPDAMYQRSLRTGRVKVCLVRSVGEGRTTAFSFSGGSAWIYLTPESVMEQDFILGMGHVVDSFVLGNSRKYDDWKLLNPEGFQYVLDSVYEPQGETENLDHLTDGENRFFADFESVGLPNIERSRLLYYAVTPGSDAVFQSPTMQKKLELMCRAIREAYGWEESKQQYPWEQYLSCSLIPE